MAIHSEHSCDVDTLYEQGKKAFDVDAFVGNEDNTDDDDDSDLPLYRSPTTKRNGIPVANNDDFDLEANRASTTAIIRRIEPPLDPQCDPFAHRVGKKLSRSEERRVGKEC